MFVKKQRLFRRHCITAISAPEITLQQVSVNPINPSVTFYLFLALFSITYTAQLSNNRPSQLNIQFPTKTGFAISFHSWKVYLRDLPVIYGHCIEILLKNQGHQYNISLNNYYLQQNFREMINVVFIVIYFRFLITFINYSVLRYLTNTNT